MSAMRPRNADDLTPAELASAAIDMDLVLAREPQLGDFGFGVCDPRSKTPLHAFQLLRYTIVICAKDNGPMTYNIGPLLVFYVDGTQLEKRNPAMFGNITL
jgi:hypothetical protein